MRDSLIRRIERLPNGLVRVDTRSGLWGTFERDGTPVGGDASRLPKVAHELRLRLAQGEGC